VVVITITDEESRLWHRQGQAAAKARVQWKRIANQIARKGVSASIKNASRVLYTVVPSQADSTGFLVTRNMSPQPWKGRK
jgi:hypothetical protein